MIVRVLIMFSLNDYQFDLFIADRSRAKGLAAVWQKEYNHCRAHASLGYRTLAESGQSRPSVSFTGLRVDDFILRDYPMDWGGKSRADARCPPAAL